MPPSMVVCVAEEIRKGNNKMGKCTDCKNLVFSSEMKKKIIFLDIEMVDCSKSMYLKLSIF